MKKAIAFAAVGSLGLASTAMAQHDPALDIVVNLDNVGTLESGDTASQSFMVGPNDGNAIVGFSFEGDFDTESGSWASDLHMTLDDNEGTTWAVGGFSTSNDEDWDFDGSQSGDNGVYAHGIGGEAWDGDGNPSGGMAGAEYGEWSVTFLMDFGTLNSLSDPTLTIHRIPAPGALALLGLAGLVGSRRRRK